MSKRMAHNLIATLVAVLYWCVLIVTAGCSMVELTRTGESVTLSYKTLFTKIETPSIYVRKDGEYEASFNAGERSVDLDDLTEALKQP
jgi:hypothetical protein